MAGGFENDSAGGVTSFTTVSGGGFEKRHPRAALTSCTTVSSGGN